jgi:YVTN family beta-propeller protein
MKLIYLLLFGSLFLSLILTSCKDGSVNTIIVDTSKNNGFLTKEVANVFSDNCATSGCHSGNNSSSGLSLDSWSDLLKGSSDRSHGQVPNYGGDVVIPGRLDESLLYQIITGNVTPAITAHAGINLDSLSINAIRDWIVGGALGYNGAVPFSHSSYRVYVNDQNSDKVSVIDGDAKVVSGIIDVKEIPQIINSPHMVKVQGNYLYVSLIAAGNFIKVDISDPTNYHIVGQTGDHTIAKAGMIILHPDGTKAFVSRSSTSDPVFTSIFAVDINTMNIIKEITLPLAGGVPHGMALTPDGSKLYCANLALSTISIIDANQNEYSDEILLPPGTEPMQTMISPDGDYLYVSARGTSRLLVFDTHADTLITQVPVNAMPMQIAVTSDGHKIYLGSMMMHTVEVIEKIGTTWTKIKSISHPGFRMMHGCDITGDDKYVYVSCRNTDPNNQFEPYYKVNGEGTPGFVGIIDTQTDEVVKFLEVEEFGAGLVVSKSE